MEEIEVMSVNSFGDNQRSTLLDESERLSVEMQLNQAMLRRSLSEPNGSLLFPGLVRQPVEQGKRGSSWGFHKMVKKLLKPMFIRRKKKSRGEDEEQEACSKDLKACKRFSKSVRL